MHERIRYQDDTGEANGNPLQDACEQMTRLLTDGVKHGFFAMTVEVETVQSKRRRITIRAGKSYQFVVSEEHVRCL
jgi:hypothetical protein